MTDIWLTGPVPGDHPRLMPVVHSLRDGLAAEIHDRLDAMRACLRTVASDTRLNAKKVGRAGQALTTARVRGAGRTDGVST